MRRRGEKSANLGSSAGRGVSSAFAVRVIGFRYASNIPSTRARTPSLLDVPAISSAASVHLPPSIQFLNFVRSFSRALSCLSGFAHVFESGSDERQRLSGRSASDETSGRE